MIDWLTFHYPCQHTRIQTGYVLKVDPDGQIQRLFYTERKVTGSYDSTVMVKSVDTKYGPAIRVTGNPSKWLQGHNLFGSDDWMGLIGAMYGRLRVVAPELELPPIPKGQTLNFDLLRMDVTYMYRCESEQDVRAWIDETLHTARSRQASAINDSGTLYFQKNSRRWAFKAYAKFPEILKHGGMPSDLPCVTQLMDWARCTLRLELVLRKQELDKLSIEQLSNPAQLFDTYRGKLTMPTQIKATDDQLDTLKPAALGAYARWERGENLKESLPKNTFYRHRRAILEATGVDISIKRELDHSNVVPFVRTIEPKPITDIPEFAKGTSLYFDPSDQDDHLKQV